METKRKPHKMKLRIGVMGAASGKGAEDPEALRISYEVGKWVAKSGCIMVTGACPGLPYAAARGALDSGGFVLGVSPAYSHQEHVQEYLSPDDTFDIILYSGLGFMERDITNIRASDAVILLGGGMGTLNEFTVAFD
ncbi:MAG: SLOG cluster 4 domain-containing protein, partial [Candidatus Xenobia bacterium]